MPLTREDFELIVLIKTDLKDVYEPSTIEQFCRSSKLFCKRHDKVKQCLEQMVEEGIVEHYGEEYMLAENVSDEVRNQWLNDVHNTEANLMKRKLSSSSYAEAVKRRESDPGMMVGACCTDPQAMKEYKRSASASALLPGVSNIQTQATAVREDRPVQYTTVHHHHEHMTVHNHHNTVVNIPVFVGGPQYNVVNAGDNANVQMGNQNEINCQERPKSQPHKRGKRRK